MALQCQIPVNAIAATVAYDNARHAHLVFYTNSCIVQRQGVQQKMPLLMTGSKHTLNPALVASSVRL